jgi:serine protease Do
MVASVVPGGPAAKAGFEQGDIVTAIDGKPVEDSRDLTRRVAAVPAGQRRPSPSSARATQEVKVTIGARPDDKVAANEPSGTELDAGRGQRQWAGLGLASVTPDARKTSICRNVVNGVVITKVDPSSDAADKGLQPGDVVMRVGSRMVKTPQDFQAGVAEAKKGGRKSVLLLVAQPGRSRFVAIDIGQA